MILVVVYVGAVAVLFLFVVMMLDVDFAELRQGFLDYLPIGGLLGVIFLIEMVLFLGTYYAAPEAVHAATGVKAAASTLSNTEQLGRVLYTDYVFYFQTAGLVLLVAMIGAIILTLHHKTGVKRQDIGAPVARSKETAMEIKSVRPGQGL
jgi:NADH-quinone oxidoreductase subunit J